MKWRALVVVGVVLGCASSGPKSVAPAKEPARCPAGFEGVAGDACLALPEHADATTPVILFFHGMYTLDAPEQEFASETRFAEGATRAWFS